MRSVSAIKANTGRAQKWNREEVKENIKEECSRIDLKTLRGISEKMEIPYTSVHRMIRQEHMMVRKSDIVKPYLTGYHLADRFVFACQQLLKQEQRYRSHSQRIHMDEKWFLLFKKNGVIYCFPEDDVPPRFVHNKNHIQRIMFFIAVTRPMYNLHGECIFDGKIGCWPFARLRQAIKDSVNRPKGTWEWKNFNVKKDDIRDMLFETVLTAIIDKFAAFSHIREFDLQWDNAPTHFDASDNVWELTRIIMEETQGIRFNLVCQPARSPDMNICDLSICIVLQVLQRKYHGQLQNHGDIIAGVNFAWNSFTHIQLEKAFCSLQTIFDEVIKSEGQNTYKIPHINKDAIWNRYGIFTLRARAEQASQEAIDIATEIFGE